MIKHTLSALLRPVAQKGRNKIGTHEKAELLKKLFINTKEIIQNCVL